MPQLGSGVERPAREHRALRPPEPAGKRDADAGRDHRPPPRLEPVGPVAVGYMAQQQAQRYRHQQRQPQQVAPPKRRVLVAGREYPAMVVQLGPDVGHAKRQSPQHQYRRHGVVVGSAQEQPAQYQRDCHDGNEPAPANYRGVSCCGHERPPPLTRVGNSAKDYNTMTQRI